jgi:integrase/recombinase XerD
MGLAAVRDEREACSGWPGGAGRVRGRRAGRFVLERAAAGLSDRTISLDVTHLEQIRAWFGRPL